LATAFKLTPGIFVLYLLATRRYRAAATAIGTFALTVAVGFVAMPGPSVSYWIDGVGADPRHVGEVNFVANQSILGSLARVVGYDAARPWWLVACVPVVLAGTWISVRARERWGDVAGLASMAFVACLVSPYSWSHHFIWFVVPALLLARAARRTGSARLRLATVAWTVPFFVGPFWFVPRAAWRLDHHPAGQALLGSWYALQLLVGFAAVGWLVSRGRSDRPAVDQAPDIDTSPMTRLAR
jgi:alpha-1,2-mannosyltransferase